MGQSKTNNKKIWPETDMNLLKVIDDYIKQFSKIDPESFSFSE